jgi:hypothetical protein
VYTKEHQALIMVSSANVGLYFSAVYQVHIKGYAFRFGFHNTSLLYPLSWNIIVPNLNALITYVGNLYHLIWYYTKPIISLGFDREYHCSGFPNQMINTDNVIGVLRKKPSNDENCYDISTVYSQTINYIYVEEFSCLTNQSILYVKNGLSTLNMQSEETFQCSKHNQTFFTIACSKHKFTRIDLYLHILDPSINLTMIIDNFQSKRKLHKIEVLQKGLSSEIMNYHYDMPQIYYSVDSYLQLTVNRFKYNGIQQNVMVDYIHNLPQYDESLRAARLPKGNNYMLFKIVTTYYSNWHLI